MPHITENITEGTTVSTDEWVTYKRLAKLGYEHDTVNHAKEEWARGTHHTNTLEAFWSLLKRSVKGTHVHVSRRHLAKYLGEFEFRWNLRHDAAADVSSPSKTPCDIAIRSLRKRDCGRLP